MRKRDLVGGHDFLTADVHHRLAQVDLDHLRFRRVAPEGVQTRRQRVDVLAVDEQHTRAVAGDRADVQQAVGRELTARSPSGARARSARSRVDRPSRARRARRSSTRTGPAATRGESAVHPHQTSLMVLQVHDHGALRQRTRLDDQVELLACTSHGSRRDTISTRTFPSGSKIQCRPASEQSLELFVAEEQTDFVAADFDSFEHEHRTLSSACRRLVLWPLGRGWMRPRTCVRRAHGACQAARHWAVVRHAVTRSNAECHLSHHRPAGARQYPPRSPPSIRDRSRRSASSVDCQLPAMAESVHCKALGRAAVAAAGRRCDGPHIGLRRRAYWAPRLTSPPTTADQADDHLPPACSGNVVQRCCSSRLSADLLGTGFEPATPRSSVWCSTIELTNVLAARSEPMYGTRAADSAVGGPHVPLDVQHDACTPAQGVSFDRLPGGEKVHGNSAADCQPPRFLRQSCSALRVGFRSAKARAFAERKPNLLIYRT